MPSTAPTLATPRVSSQTDRRRRNARVVNALLLVVPLVVLAVAAWNYRWMSDDGFINLRVVSQLTSGHGPVFNQGERVEAATSPLWIYVLTAADLLLPLRLEWIAVLTGITLTVTGTALAMLGASRLVDRDERTILVPVGALMLAVLPPMWKFASSGLENGLTFAWLGASCALLGAWARADRRLASWAAIVLGLGPLVRPELALFSVLFLAIVLGGQWRADTWRSRALFLAAALALPLGYELFRIGYYASLVPNPAFAKEVARSYWSAGWEYLRQPTVTYALWVPIIVVAIAVYLPTARRARRDHERRVLLVLLAFAVGALIDATYIIRVGGDFMHARLLLPALFAFMAPVAVVALRREALGALLIVPWALVVLVAIRSVDDAPNTFANTRNAVIIADFGLNPGMSERAWFSGLGVYYDNRRLTGEPLDRNPAVAAFGLGVTSYALGPDVYFLDLLGLADPLTSHLELEHRGTIAHEKPLPTPWIPARLLAPDTPVVSNELRTPQVFYARPIDDPRGQSMDDRVADARAALRCARLREFVATYSAPLDGGRVLENFRDAFENYAFRIPPEPRDARTAMCA